MTERKRIIVDPPIPVSIEPPEGYVLLNAQTLKNLYPPDMFKVDFQEPTKGNRAERRAAKRRRRP